MREDLSQSHSGTDAPRGTKWFVPGWSKGGVASKLFVVGGLHELYCVSAILFRVLYIKERGLDITLFYLLCLFVIVPPQLN
jgi:hypothetical protein